MNKIIYKYPLEIIDEQVVLLPAYARLLTVQAQYDIPCLWALVNPVLPNEVPVTVRIFGTGHPIEDTDNLEYIGTFQILGGKLVYHAFVKLQKGRVSDEKHLDSERKGRVVICLQKQTVL